MSATSQPSPQLFFDAASAFQRSAALRAAVDLGLFTTIGGEALSAKEVGGRIEAPERSTAILCDYLSFQGFLTKTDGRYRLTEDSALFLDGKSPAYLGSALEFIHNDTIKEAFADLATTVRNGGTTLTGKGAVELNHPMWVDFARGMAPLMRFPAQLMAEHLSFAADQEARVLDIAAGHGLFGIELARRNPKVRVTAQDAPAVLEVAQENATTADVSDRYQTLSGDAFAIELGHDYDLVLLTNFLHHFDVPTCEQLLRKVAAALKPGGRVATLEFLIHEDKISPEGSAGFPLMMLATTPSGNAYTFAEIESMFQSVGLQNNEMHDLQPSMQQLVVSRR